MDKQELPGHFVNLIPFMDRGLGRLTGAGTNVKRLALRGSIHAHKEEERHFQESLETVECLSIVSEWIFDFQRVN